MLYITKIFKLDDITNENKRERNKKWLFNPDYTYKILTIRGSGSGKTKTLPNLIKEQDDIDKIYFHAKDLSEPKYDFLNVNMLEQNIVMIQMNFLSVRILWMRFMRRLMSTTQAKKEKF